MFLAGYPNDGCAVIDRKTQTAKVYDTIPEAKQYYKKLSSIYEQGVIDPETFMPVSYTHLDVYKRQLYMDRRLANAW